MKPVPMYRYEVTIHVANSVYVKVNLHRVIYRATSDPAKAILPVMHSSFPVSKGIALQL